MKTRDRKASAAAGLNGGLEPPRLPGTNRRRRLSAGMILAGGILTIAGSGLPWEIVTSSATGTVTRGGFETSDAFVFLVLGGVVALAGILGFRRAPSGYWRAMLLFISGLLAVASLADGIELQRSINAFNAQFLGQSVAALGIGLYAIGLGAILSIVGAILMPGRPRLARATRR